MYPASGTCGSASLVFRVSKGQLATRDAVAADLRKKADRLNVVIAAFNREVEPLAQAVAEAQADYNTLMETARNFTSQISESTQKYFDAKSERWQNSDQGIEVRLWIERWEMSLEDIDVGLPEQLEQVDPDEHASQLEAALATPAGSERVH